MNNTMRDAELKSKIHNIFTKRQTRGIITGRAHVAVFKEIERYLSTFFPRLLCQISFKKVTMPELVWNREMTRTLLEHLEKHKGESGLYIIDKQRALGNAQKMMLQRHPSQPVTIEQISKKFEILAYRNMLPNYKGLKTLWRKGKSVLYPKCYEEKSVVKQSSKAGSGNNRLRKDAGKTARFQSVQTKSEPHRPGRRLRLRGNRTRRGATNTREVKSSSMGLSCLEKPRKSPYVDNPKQYYAENQTLPLLFVTANRL